MQIVFDATELGYWGSFSPEYFTTPGKMLGGSEANVVSMANAFAKQGHEVIVFRPSNDDKTENYGGVQYAPSYKFQEYCEKYNDIDIILSTNNGFHNVFANEKLQPCLKLDYLPCCAIYASPEHIAGTDYFLYVSEFQKKHIMAYGVPEEKLLRINHGYEERFFDAGNIVPFEQRENKLIYTASPDRGLHIALDIFKLILEQVPNAEFHIFYEVERWLQQNKYNMFAEGERAASILQGIKQKNVFLRGPLCYSDLAKEYSTAKILLYPCDPLVPTEAHPKTVLEACVSGTPAMLSGADCLPELFPKMCLGQNIVKSRWADYAVKLLTDETAWNVASLCGEGYEDRTWDNVVTDLIWALKDKEE